MTVPITFFHGLVIRQSALKAKGISRAELLKLFETEMPYGESSDLLSFGPSFGQDACNEFIRRLKLLGLNYIDDFFDLVLDHPDWLKFSASLSRPPA